MRFFGNDGGRIQYHAEGQRHSSRVAGNKHRDHGNAQSTGEREPVLGFVLPVAECDIAPTFFDGTYFSSTPDGSSTHNDTTNIRPLMGYSVPKWRYLYNTTLVVLDLLMTIVSTYIVFLLRPFAYTYVQSIGPGEYGVFSFLLLTCVSWLISLYSARSYERHTMGEGYALYAKLLNAAFIDFIMLCTLGYLFHLNLPRSLNVFIPLVSLVLVIIERWIMRRALHRNRMNSEFNYPTVVIGSPEGIHRTVEQLRQCRGLGYAPIAGVPSGFSQERG